MHRFRRRLALVPALSLLFLGTVVTSPVSPVSPAGATHVIPCGATIDRDTTLLANVGPCPTGDGLIVRNDPTGVDPNVELNLNGYRVFSNSPLPRNVGVDSTTGFWIPADVVGIKLVGATGATVRNGVVSGFNAGVSIEGGGSNVVKNLKVQNNQAPCIGEDFSTFAVGQYGDGVVVFGSQDNLIMNNLIRNNGPFSGIAIVANSQFITAAVPPYPSGNVIRGNLVVDNNLCFADIGIRVEGPGATGTQVVNNTVRNSFQEGIVVHPVNVIDFRPLFQSPPACQNRGFPSPTLPQCPIQDPPNPTNDDVLIKGNNVVGNGFGGQSINAGPDRANAPSPQAATGINLLSFCGYGAKSDATGTVVKDNRVVRNAGDGINAGGCPLGQDPASGTFPGFQNSLIKANAALDNNRAGCGTLPANPGCGGRPTNPRFDLRDSTNQIVCPSTSASTQAICASLGYLAPPAAPDQFVGTPVIQPGGVACGTNTWVGNRYGTAFPSCTTVDGKQVTLAAPVAQQSAQAAESVVQGESRPYPIRARKR